MATCTHVSSCPLFALFTLDATLSLWRQNYCEEDYARCARYRGAERGREVPHNLLPNGKLLRVMPMPER